MWWGNQELELQEWGYFIKSNKIITLAIIRLVLNNNPQGYKKHVISFISFAFGEGVNIIYCIANMKLSLYNIEES